VSANPNLFRICVCKILQGWEVSRSSEIHSSKEE
jgi:hypothetical protein